MKIFNKEINLEKSLIIFYFLVGLIEVSAQVLYNSCYCQYVFKLLMTMFLSILYWCTSKRRNPLFFINLVLLLIGRLYFIPNDIEMLYFALIAISLHRIVEMYYISKLIKLKDLIPPVLASIPFLFFFLYLVSIHETVIIKSYMFLIVQIVLISALSGIILSQYLTYDKKDVWLFIFGLMSLMQTFIVFIEKFYLSDIQLNILRPSSLLLNTIICFTFYKFVVTSEKSS